MSDSNSNIQGQKKIIPIKYLKGIRPDTVIHTNFTCYQNDELNYVNLESVMGIFPLAKITLIAEMFSFESTLEFLGEIKKDDELKRLFDTRLNNMYGGEGVWFSVDKKERSMSQRDSEELRRVFIAYTDKHGPVTKRDFMRDNPQVTTARWISLVNNRQRDNIAERFILATTGIVADEGVLVGQPQDGIGIVSKRGLIGDPVLAGVSTERLQGTLQFWLTRYNLTEEDVIEMIILTKAQVKF